MDVFSDPRKRAYLNNEGGGEALKSPLGDDVLNRARHYRLARLREQLVLKDCAAILLYDPINIRYATDSSNMQLWTMHNAVRYALIFAMGPCIMFEFKHCDHICKDLPGVDEVRTATGWIYISGGQRSNEFAVKWALEIEDLIREYGDGNRRLAVDKVEPTGMAALESCGISIVEGQELTEKARSIKSVDELNLMRWTIRVCEAGMARMFENATPGKTENEIWAELHYENIRSGGEWCETRIFACGDHTNPWYQECSDRVCHEGEMISFDTDLIGPYGYCADISRSWTCGYTPMNDTQKRLYATAREQIEHNLALIKPGLSHREFLEKQWQIPEDHVDYRYSLAAHGVGLADEWPVLLLPPDEEGAYDLELRENMVLCVESLIAEKGSESIKLETQVVVTAGGHERLDSFPWEEV